jgi:hypothetical protein
MLSAKKEPDLIPRFVPAFILGLNCLFIITTCLRVQAVSERPGRDDRIGVCTHFSQNWSVEQIMPLIARSGAGWLRDDLNWADLERTPGNYQIPPKTERLIQAARRVGLKVDLIMAYGNPAYIDHYDTAAYAKAAGWFAREAANDVQVIEVLNEPNNFGFRATYGGRWNGNEPDGSVSPYLRKYVQLLNATANEIKLANPEMKVIGLGTPAPASFRMIALGLASRVDGLTDHPYGGQLPELVPYAATPDLLRRDGIATADTNGTLASQVSMFREQAKKWGATEKLWHTEWGYATVRAKPGKPGMSEETQAVYILRRLLESEASGVEHTFIYDFKDDGIDPYSQEQNFGLVHNNLSAKPAYFALQRLTGFLAGMGTADPTTQAWIENDPAVKPEGVGHRCHTFSSPDAQKIVVAFWEAKPWDPNAMPAKAVITLPAVQRASHIFLFNLLSGNQTEIPAKTAQDVFDQVPPNAQTQDSAHAKSAHRVSVVVSLSAVPQLLIVR